MRTNPFLRSWKTTTVAVLVFVIALSRSIIALLDGDPETGVNAEALVDAFIAAMVAVGFWSARDSDKSSQDVGIRN
jgi:hypothetical protein